MIRAFIQQRTIIYGFGSYKRLKIATLLQFVFGGKRSLENTINLVMGGVFHEHVERNTMSARIYDMMKVNYVESKSMIEQLKINGVNNARFFPNARSEKRSRKPKAIDEKMIKCVFFSQISTQKGVRDIMNMYDEISDEEKKKVAIDFYGHIVDEIRSDFEAFIKRYDNVNYGGVFDAVQGDVYGKLNEYDVLLFPTRWDCEGVPGILVEAKMAGLCPIVTDKSFNSEIVLEGKEGIVIQNDYSKEMGNAIRMLMNSNETLMKLKKESYDSRLRYAMEQYADELRNTIFY